MREIWALVNEMSPYLLLGFAFAGLLHSFVPASLYRRYLGKNSFSSVIWAALLSPKYFSKLVRQASGKLPMEHIQQRVIIEAKSLLRSTNITIREIADALNFPTDSFFCRYFKHETGLSPSDYRQSFN